MDGRALGAFLRIYQRGRKRNFCNGSEDRGDLNFAHKKILAKKIAVLERGGVVSLQLFIRRSGRGKRGEGGEFSNIFLQIRPSHQCMLHAEDSV